MKLTYTKISKNIFKFFYQENKRYGEFYIRLEKNGEASLEMKDPDYGHDLIIGLVGELMPETMVIRKEQLKHDLIMADHKCSDTVYGNDCEYCNNVRKTIQKIN